MPEKRSALPFEDGPFLSVACICEKVLVEQDGVKSVIRVIDRLIHTVAGPQPPEDLEPFEHDMTLLIKLKSGSARGVYPIEVRLIKPSGESPPPFSQSVMFEGEEDRGVDIIMRMKIIFDMAGVYWFEIDLKGTRLTRLPFRVVYMPQVMQIGGPSGDQKPG